MHIPAVRLFLLSVLFLVCTSLTYPQFSVWQKKFNGQGLCVGINPQNPNTIYSQGTDNRLYVSRDQGKTWTMLPPSLPSQLREILVHPKDSLTMFVVDFSNGLRKSTNGGSSWTTVLSPYGIDGESVRFDPVNTDTIYAGNFSDAAVYRSTDRGSTWALRGHAGTTGNLCTIAVRPDSANILYAGSGQGTISKSTNGGTTWYQVKSGGSVEIPRIIINPANPLIAYAAAFSGNRAATGVWKTIDGGEHWSLTGLNNIFMWSLEIDPLHPDTLYSGTFSEFSAGVYKTTNGGISWTLIDKGFTHFNSIWNLKVDPVNTGNVYVGATLGDFGQDGTYKLGNATSGMQGLVRDSLTLAPLNTGAAVMNPPGTSINLNFSSASYGFYKFDDDTNSVHTITASSSLHITKQVPAVFINSVITNQDILLRPIPKGLVRGTVFNDLNNNGVKNGGEPGLTNWTIRLSGDSTASVTSDVNGNYVIGQLLPGNYTVSEVVQYGYTQTLPLTPSYSMTITPAGDTLSGKDFGNYFRHHVLSVSPLPYSNANARNVAIQAVFDTAMDPSTFNDSSSWIVQGSFSGRHAGLLVLSAGNSIATFTPADSFQIGEVVTVNLTNAIHIAAGGSITPYTFRFEVRVPHTTVGFSARVDYTTGSAPWAVAVADLDGDGDNDIVTANVGGNNISVLKNNGNGTFAPRVDYTAGFSPRSIAVGDIDRDGDIDVVVANSGFSTVSVFKNNGDGTFPPRADYPAGGAPSSVSLTDIDGDGFLDIVTVNSSVNTITVLKNNGDGTFAAPVSSPAGSSPWGLATADLSGDGGTDVVVTNSATPTSTISQLTNMSNNVFTTQSTYTIGGFARGITIADFNNDNRPDLIAANSSTNTISTFAQNVGGSYAPRADFPSGAGPWGVATADLNGDGLMDILVANATANTVSFFENIGGSSFIRTDYPTGSVPRDVAVADLDNDGDLDLVVANSSGNSVSILKNALVFTSASDWNLFSVPLRVANMAKTNIYPAAISNAFAYEGSYVHKDTLKVGQGYWLKYDSTRTVAYDGVPVHSDTIILVPSWNLIGTVSFPVPVSSLTTNPSGIIASSFFGYNGAYQLADTLQPGYGYWVKASAGGSLFMNSSAANPATAEKGSATDLYNTLTLEDKIGKRQTLYFTSNTMGQSLSRYDLPPVPPLGSFDARFATQRLAVDATGISAARFPISVNGATYPLTLQWKIMDATRHWVIDAGTVHKQLSPKGSITINAPVANGELALLTTGGNAQSVPKEFALGQNFPNPFNPSTVIRYQIPVASMVKLSIYNLLGQEVAILVDGVQDAGYKSAEWNASRIASGVYFYKLQAGRFDEMRRLILLR